VGRRRYPPIIFCHSGVDLDADLYPGPVDTASAHVNAMSPTTKPSSAEPETDAVAVADAGNTEDKPVQEDAQVASPPKAEAVVESKSPDVSVEAAPVQAETEGEQDTTKMEEKAATDEFLDDLQPPEWIVLDEKNGTSTASAVEAVSGGDDDWGDWE